jgi:hypothetical protein
VLVWQQGEHSLVGQHALLVIQDLAAMMVNVQTKEEEISAREHSSKEVNVQKIHVSWVLVALEVHVYQTLL